MLQNHQSETKELFQKKRGKKEKSAALTSEHSSALMKSHSSLSILETWPLPFSSAQGTLLLPLTTLQSERIVSLFLALKRLSFQGVFSLLSPSLLFTGLIQTFSFLFCFLFFFFPAQRLLLQEWLAGELGRAPALQREGNIGEGLSTLGPPTASQGRLH